MTIIYTLFKYNPPAIRNRSKISSVCNMMVLLAAASFFWACLKLNAGAQPIVELINTANSQFTDESAQINRDLYYNGEDPKFELFMVRDDLIRDHKGIIINSPDDLKLGPYYKVYDFPEKLNLKRFLMGYKLESVVPHLNFYWEAPVYARDRAGRFQSVSSYSVLRNKLDKRRWHISSYGGLIGPYYADISSNPVKTENVLRRIDLSDGQYFAHFHLPDSFDFFYVIKGGNEYFVPIYSGRTNNYGLKNDYPYNRALFMSHIDPLISSGGNHSMPAKLIKTRNSTVMPYPYFLTVIAAIIIILFGVFKLAKIKK